ncbi:MAG TPA: hypothetical protein VK063_00390 [Beutenbergiaceae bacterium]|nr:hypothetical protein [Beutenbergiaceae bacterium]
MEQNEPAQEASQDPSPAAPPSDRDVDGSADQPSDDSTDTATTTEQPSPGFEDVPEGYYVVDNGRAMVAERAGAGCEGMPGLEPRPDDDEHRVHGYWYSQLRDVGPIARATGEAIYDDDGQPVAYVAAPGDTMRAIAARFCIDHYPYLEWINAIRRGDRTSIMDTASMTLYAGDTINLNPYTIATVGDENGVVRDNAIDFHIPPQH